VNLISPFTSKSNFVYWQPSVSPEAPSASLAPQATGQIVPKSKGGPGPASRRKLPFPPKRKQFGRKKVDFKNALFKVLRKIDSNGTISSKAMTVLNDMMCDLLERLAREAQAICERNGKTTLKTRDIQTAARILLPGQLFTHAFYEGHRCLSKLLEFDERARLARQ
jgi:histone H2B